MAEAITQLLLQWRDGDPDALDELMPLVYEELRRQARTFMRRERPDHTFETSALLNEAYLRLFGTDSIPWQNRAHFFAVASQVMRRILIDHARSYNFLKRGGGAQKVELDEAMALGESRARELIDLDDALTTLAKLDPRRSRVVELRFFGGLDINETAAALGVSETTVQREWRAAQCWLRRFITGSDLTEKTDDG